MSAATDRSDRSDLEVLQSGHRSKLVVIAALVAAAAGAWWYTRGGPIGAPEEGSSILVVTRGDYRYRYAMEELGFKVLEGTQTAFETKAKETMPDYEGAGVAAILRLADYGGYAYVAFEGPQDVDFTGVEILGGVPTFTPEQRFAVVSAGDYAFPHRLTVTQPRSELVPGVDLDLLTALFAQDVLARALDEADPKKATPEVLILRGRLERAIERVKTIAEAERTVGKIQETTRELLVDKERGEPKPRLLATVAESIHPIPLADGGVLTPSREIHFTSKNGLSADLELDDTWRFLYQPAGTSPADRSTCTTLLGGSLAQGGRRPRFRSSPAGDALLIDSGGAASLFRLDRAGGPCGFAALGEVPRLAQPGDDPGVPHRSGWVARARQELAGDAVLELVRPGDEPPLDLVRSDQITLGAPVWLDDDHLAVVARSRTGVGGQGVLLVSRNHPGFALEIGPQVLGGSYDAYEVAAASVDADAPRLVVTGAGPHLHRLYRVDLPGPLAQLFTDASAARRDDADLTLVAVDPARLVAVELTTEGAASEPVVSPDGARVAYAVSRLDSEPGGDDEIGLVRIDGEGGARLLTKNDLDDHTPLFTADSRQVVFRTKYPIERTTWTLTTGRVVDVDR